MKKKRILIISSVLFVILIFALFISYGYITAYISGNETSKKTVFNSQIIKVEYSDGIETLTSNQVVFTPGSTITKTFTIKNTGNVIVKYSINLDDVINDFTRKDDITYELSSDNVILKNGIYDAKGVFPDNKLTILNKDTLNIGESKTYALKINYLNSEKNQIADSGKNLSAKIVIDESIPTINKLVIYGNSIQDGIPTPETPIEIESVGDKTKNLFSGLIKGKMLNTTTGKEDTNSNASVSDYIPVDFTNNSLYILSGLSENLSSLICGYNANKEFIGMTTVLKTNKIVLSQNTLSLGTPQGTGDIAYIRVMHYPLSGDTGEIDDIDDLKIQLEKGSVATDYEPYGYKIPVKVSDDLGNSIVTNIYLNEPLRKIGEYSDYIDFETGEVVRNIKNLLLYGDIKVTLSDWRAVDGYYAVGYALNKIPDIYKSNNIGFILCDKLSNKTYANLYSTSNPVEGISTASSATYSIFIRIKSNEIKTLSNYYEYLNSHPLNIFYVLETRDNDRKKIELPNIILNKGSKIVEVCSSNGICASNVEVEYDE